MSDEGNRVCERFDENEVYIYTVSAKDGMLA